MEEIQLQEYQKEFIAKATSAVYSGQKRLLAEMVNSSGMHNAML
jgi:hypothetical protein